MTWAVVTFTLDGAGKTRAVAASRWRPVARLVAQALNRLDRSGLHHWVVKIPGTAAEVYAAMARVGASMRQRDELQREVLLLRAEASLQRRQTDALVEAAAAANERATSAMLCLYALAARESDGRWTTIHDEGTELPSDAQQLLTELVG
jgi:hypothetical protein